MEIRDYARVLRTRWIVIVIVVLIGMGLAGAYSFLATPTYQATTKLYVSVRAGETAASGDLVQGTSFARQAVTSYVDVVVSAVVLDRVIEELDLPETSAELATHVRADSPLNTVLITVTVTDEDPQQAALIANSVGKNFSTEVMDNLEKPSGDSPSLVRIEPIQPAIAPSTPSNPNVPLNLLLGGLIGLTLGVGIAILRSVLDTRVHSLRDIEQITDKPLLGGIPLDPDAKKRPLIVHVDPRNPRAESFRSLRTNVQFVGVDGGPRTFVVTSAGPGEGKSTTAANLALALAETGARVILIDADLRVPKIAEYLGIEGAVGLTDLLIGTAALADVVQSWGRDELSVIPAGRIPPNPSEMLGARAMAELLASLAEQYEYVILDAPPLLLVTDASVVAKSTEGAILVAASGRTGKQQLAGAVRALAAGGGHLAGIVVTMLPTRGPDSYGYGMYSYDTLAGPASTPRQNARPRWRF